MKHSSVRDKYNDDENPSAKKFALVKGGKILETELTLSGVLRVCEKVKLHEQSGEYEKAAELLAFYWTRNTGAVRLSGMTEIEAAALLLRVGSVCSAIGSAGQIKESQSEARDYLCQAERIFSDLGNREGIAQCQNKIGVTYWRNGDFHSARSFFEMSFENAQTDDSRAIALVNTGMLENCEHKYLAALAALQSAYLYIGRISTLNEAIIRNEIGVVYEVYGNTLDITEREAYLDKALIEYEGALFCFESVGHKPYQICVRNNIGQLFYTLSRFPEALQALEVAKTQAYQLQDKINIGIVCDTLCTVYLAIGDYESALANASIAVQKFAGNENSYRLAISLANYAVAQARRGAAAAARETFAEALETAHYIGDRTLAARVRLFELREFFAEYKDKERLSIYSETAKILGGVQEKDITDTLEQIEQAIESGASSLTDTAEESALPEVPAAQTGEIVPMALDAELRRVEREYIEKAIAATGGNQSKTAAMLGLSRQRLMHRLKKYFPALLGRMQQISKPGQTGNVGIFPTHSIISTTEMKKQDIRVAVLEEDFHFFRTGDALLVKVGTWTLNSIVLLGEKHSPNIKIGWLRLSGETGYALETADKEFFEFDDEGLANILGEAVGYCPADEYRIYINRKSRGQRVTLPYCELKN